MKYYSLFLLLITFFALFACSNDTHTHQKSTMHYDEQSHWYNCNSCDELIDKQNHLFSDWIITHKATCTDIGSQSHTCQICNYQESMTINTLGHEPGNAADCINDQICTRCKTVLTSKTDHHYTKTIIDGITHYTCKCGDTHIDTTIGDDPYDSDIYD